MISKKIILFCYNKMSDNITYYQRNKELQEQKQNCYHQLGRHVTVQEH